MRKLAVAVAWAFVAHPASARAEDDGGAVRAAMTCDHADPPGRVRCDVEARVPTGRTIRWGDVVIVRTPAFASALRGRIGPRDASAREPDTWRWALALVARERGQGEVEGRVRLVVCEQAKCAPAEVAFTARLVVGE